ncbi:lytic transglycosylase, partial [Raoultella planticola]
MKLPAIFLSTLLFLPQAQAYCFNYAAAKYNQNPLVVESIA